MQLRDSIAFITGSNRGLGRALVDDLLARGARRVYAASRAGTSGHTDPRVVPVRLDVTDRAQVAAAARAAADATLLVNNAGSLASMSVLQAEPAQLQRDLDVNFHGVLETVRAFAATLVAARGALVNVLSVASLASMPALGGYAASKAAAWSLTQALRGELGPQGVAVHAVFPGPIDTDMIRAFDLPKTSPEDVARAILDGVAAGTLDIAPDPMARDVLATFTRDPGALERRFAS